MVQVHVMLQYVCRSTLKLKQMQGGQDGANVVIFFSPSSHSSCCNLGRLHLSQSYMSVKSEIRVSESSASDRMNEMSVGGVLHSEGQQFS